MEFKPTHTNKHLKKGHLQKLITQAEEQDRALVVVKSLLDKPLNEHVTGMIIKNKIATILVENQIWATKLRYMTPTLKEDISQALEAPIYALQVKVMANKALPTEKKPVKTKKIRNPVPSETLYNAAAALDDPELSEILARIATKANDC